MLIDLHSNVRKAAFLASTSLLITILGICSACHFLAAYYSAKLDLVSLRRATRLEPWNADYQHLLGRYYLLADPEPELAEHFLKTAVSLNPRDALSWLDLSTANQLLMNSEGQRYALERAIAADPTVPELAWQAANYYLARGENNRALDLFRVVLANDPALTSVALESCWRIQPDTEALLKGVLPPDPAVYSVFLSLLISRDERAGATEVWQRLVQLRQPIERRYVFEYVRYLIEHRDANSAAKVWRQAASLSDLSAYQPSLDNLIINGDFSAPMLNAGFDWLYEQSPSAALAFDSAQTHMGHSHSLSISFDSPHLSEVGIRQYIPVQPNSRYRFIAYFRTEDLRGAGGPRFVLQDAFTGAPCFTSDELKDAAFWTEINGPLETHDNTLLQLMLLRVPAGNAIRGKLWIDGIRLVPQSAVIEPR